MDNAATPSTRVLADWHAAVNAGDVQAAVDLCTDDVAVAGPRGVGHGRELVRGWLTRSGIRLEPRQPLPQAADGRFVVEELAHWSGADLPEGAPREPTVTWCVFEVVDGRIASIARYASAADVPSGPAG